MKACIIFNPVARGDKARHLRSRLAGVEAEFTLKPTSGPGDAQRLAAQAVGEGFDLIVAAGGDGTVNEVLNGIASVPDGPERARLGVLPLGTMNVLARELKIPFEVGAALDVVRSGKELKIDLPWAEFQAAGKTERRCFVQLAGAGFDARAIELVSWRLKKKNGLLAYLIAGTQALSEQKPKIMVRCDGQEVSGEFVMVGNGRFYGGSVAAFPGADLCDGVLDVCVFREVTFWMLARGLPHFLRHQTFPEKLVRRVTGRKFELSADGPAAFELDGEWVGHLPATFSVEPRRLRVVVP